MFNYRANFQQMLKSSQIYMLQGSETGQHTPRQTESLSKSDYRLAKYLSSAHTFLLRNITTDIVSASCTHRQQILPLRIKLLLTFCHHYFDIVYRTSGESFNQTNKALPGSVQNSQIDIVVI